MNKTARMLLITALAVPFTCTMTAGIADTSSVEAVINVEIFLKARHTSSHSMLERFS